MNGRVQHQVGLPYHWGSRGLTTGGSANDLSHMALDPNVHIQEVKAFTCDIRPGRRPRGARAAAVRRRDPRARERRGARMIDRAAAWPETYGDEAKPRVGFFTDTSICIGCKACEVACKEWNVIPEDGLVWTGESYDNTSTLGANSWRHVAFVEQRKPLRTDGEVAALDARAAALADVARTSASTARTRRASTSARPARSSARSSGPSSCRRTSATAAATACRRARSACSTSATCRARRATRRSRCRCSARRRTAASGSARSATTGSRAATSRRARRRARRTRSSSASSTSSASAPTRGSRSSRRRAGTARSCTAAIPTTASAASARSSCCSTSRRSTACRPIRSSRRSDLPSMWKTTAIAAAATVVGTALAFLGGRGVSVTERGTEMRSYYDRPILKEPVWQPEIPFYFFTGGIAGGCSRAPRARALRGPGAAREDCAGGATLIEPGRWLASGMGVWGSTSYLRSTSLCCSGVMDVLLVPVAGCHLPPLSVTRTRVTDRGVRAGTTPGCWVAVPPPCR